MKRCWYTVILTVSLVGMAVWNTASSWPGNLKGVFGAVISGMEGGAGEDETVNMSAESVGETEEVQGQGKTGNRKEAAGQAAIPDKAAGNTDGMAGNADGMASNIDGTVGNAGGMAGNINGTVGNAGGMAGNTDGMAGNAGGMAGNINGTVGNAGGMAGNTNGIAGNTNGTVGNAGGIAGNTNGTVGNAGGMAGNTGGIAGNTNGTMGNAGGIAGNTDGIAGNTNGTVGNTNGTAEAKRAAFPAYIENFKDVLFIGDSRTVGLSEYGDLGEAEVFANTGMSVFNVFDEKVSMKSKEKKTLNEVLSEHSFKQIYLMLGINELGYEPSKTVAQYQRVVSRIKEMQPEAVLVLEANLHVTQKKSSGSSIYTNGRIDALNQEVKKIADSENSYFIDINNVFDDENGNLAAEYSTDGTHVLGKYYSVWTEWIKKSEKGLEK